MLYKIYKTLLDILFPKQCLSCKVTGSHICVPCLEMLPKAYQSKELPAFIHAELSYKHPVVKKLIWKLKYEHVSDIAEETAPILSDAILAKAEEMSMLGRMTVVLVPIPIHRSKQRVRRYNQAALLVRAIVEELGDSDIHADYTSLVKIKQTGAQMKTKNKSTRLANIIGSFAVSPLLAKKLQKSHVILVDDVVTTGATIREARKILLAAGVQSVSAVVLAH